MRERSLLLVAASLVLCGPAMAASTADKFEKWNGKAKYAKTWKKCQKLSAGARENPQIREPCARAELEVLLTTHGDAINAELLEEHWTTWATTAAGQESKNRHGLILLSQTGDDIDALLTLVQDFEGTEAADTAQARIWELAFSEAADEDTASAWSRALEAWPNHPEREWMERRRMMALGREFSVTLSVGEPIPLAEINGGEDPPVVPMGEVQVEVDAVDPSMFPAVDIQVLVEGEYVDFLDVLPLAMEAAGVPDEIREPAPDLIWAPQADPLLGAVNGAICRPEADSLFTVRVRVPGVELRYPFTPAEDCEGLSSLMLHKSQTTLMGRSVTFGGSINDFRRALPEAGRISRGEAVEVWGAGALEAHFWHDRLVSIQVTCDGDTACQGEESLYLKIRDEIAGQLPKTGSEMRSFSDAVGVGDGEIVFRESGTLRSSERVFVTERDGAPHRRMLIYDEGLMQLAEGLAREFTGDEF